MSYSIYIGKNLSAEGCVFLAGYGDEPSSHWLEVTPARTYPPESTIRVGVTEKADFPGYLSEIPQVEKTAKYLGVSYSYYKGVPAPLINGGLNEHHVAVRDVWSTSRQELQDMTPKKQKGVNYSDLARILLERATSAREGVQIIGELIAKYGYATYGGNSHMIADKNEGWIVIEFAGGQGLWAAERLGEDDIRISRPGYIGEMPLNYKENPDYDGSDNLIDFAIAQGWYSQKDKAPFNVNKIYGDGEMQWEGVSWTYNELLKKAKSPQKITFQDVIWAVRTPKLTGDMAGYGQIVQLFQEIHPEIAALWHTQTCAVSAPFVPFYMGIKDIPPEYKKHRYLTANESALFINPEEDEPEQRSSVSQSIESTCSAFRVFKRLFYLTMQHAEKFLPEVTETFEAYEEKLISQHTTIQKAALTLYEAGEDDLARDYLTYFSKTEAMKALQIAKALSQSIEVRTRLLFGFDENTAPGSPDVLW